MNLTNNTTTAATTTMTKVDDNEYVPTRRSIDEQVVQTKIPTSPTKTVVPIPTPISTRESKVQAIKKTQEILAAKENLKKKQEEKRKEAIKLTADLRKRKQELLDKHLIEIRALIERAEKNPDQKDTIMETIKTIQQSIDNLRKDLGTNGQTNNNNNNNNSDNNNSKSTTTTKVSLSMNE